MLIFALHCCFAVCCCQCGSHTNYTDSDGSTLLRLDYKNELTYFREFSHICGILCKKCNISKLSYCSSVYCWKMVDQTLDLAHLFQVKDG